jgi:4-alpha-glucanotransferase
MNDQALDALAAEAGLELRWVDVTGTTQTVPQETLRAVLAALGLPAGSDAEIAESRAKLDGEKHAVPPLLTAWTGETFTAGGVSLSAPEAPGYYQVEIGGAERTLAVAPPRCFGIADVTGRRLAGVGVQLYGLRHGHTAGFGDFAALGDIAHQAAAHGFDAVAVSPTHALYTAEPRHISPYSPSSRVFFNPLYADSGLFGGDVEHDDEADGLIDWPRAAAAKLASLRRAHEAFLAGANHDEFRAFCAEGGEHLQRHAVFEALDAHFRLQHYRSWRVWPKPYRDASGFAVAEFARAHGSEIAFHLFLQFLTAKSADAAQMRARQAGMQIGLIADIATGIDPNGSDCWSAPDDVLMGLSIGAPPDPFNVDGQGWGLTVLSPSALKNKGFEAFLAMLRANMAHGGGIRIDHVMGLMRLWVIPEGAKPTEGAYLRYPLEDLLRLTALESHRCRSVVIGEDLGTVPYGFRDVLSHRGIAGMQVLWFERERHAFRQPYRWRSDALAMTTTHDLPTLAGWWRGRDIAWRERIASAGSVYDAETERRLRAADRHALWLALEQAGCVEGDPPPPDNPEPMVDGALAYVGITPSPLAIAGIEDLLALVEQPNLPGTIDEHPNWRRRLPPGDVFADQDAVRRTGVFIRARKQG